MKSHKGAAKRFKVTGRGKVLRRKQGGLHLRRKKSKRALHTYDKKLAVSSADRRAICRALGVGQRQQSSLESEESDS
jgi:large subunit ribosomal protein L35